MFEKLIPEEYKKLINTKYENESSEKNISRRIYFLPSEDSLIQQILEL